MVTEICSITHSKSSVVAVRTGQVIAEVPVSSVPQKSNFLANLLTKLTGEKAIDEAKSIQKARKSAYRKLVRQLTNQGWVVLTTNDDGEVVSMSRTTY